MFIYELLLAGGFVAVCISSTGWAQLVDLYPKNITSFLSPPQFGLICIVYAVSLFGISVVVACWEDKLRRIMTDAYIGNQFLSTPNGYVKPQTGAAAAAATFGFAACALFLAEALMRFRRLGDKMHR
ncbi:unnamed protein product [Didymodactylos carnosus]|uniref:CASP-like protein n=1 Tax=Didymodactylos carnosus TaxID=1234261 RepID=A0A8S2F496_9BILA|nr:unnamed protein product [Didymodactylos carnosus]CAF4198572.1 unnamed protein product [Didymodactylos carnosus]